MKFNEREGQGLNLKAQGYLSKLQILPIRSSFEQFRSMRLELLWTVNLSSDIACAIAKITQITVNGCDLGSDAKLANQVVKHLQKNSVVLHHLKLDHKTLDLRTYADSSHLNNKDLSTNLGFLIFLCYAISKVAITNYRP